jgi:serine/threonine protein kinase
MNEILMEYYPHNLREMLHSQGKLLSFREKLILAKRIAAAINWLANQYVCHRDIKPDNIMISEHRIPKLIDFGSCCPVYGIGNQYFLVKETRRKSFCS